MKGAWTRPAPCGHKSERKRPKKRGSGASHATRVKLLRGRKGTRELSTGQITQRAEELSFSRAARSERSDTVRGPSPFPRTNPPAVCFIFCSLSLSLSLSLSSSTVVGIHISPLCCVGGQTFCCCCCIVIPWLSRADGPAERRSLFFYSPCQLLSFSCIVVLLHRPSHFRSWFHEA